MNIQWYPGHMAKTKRMMQENISLVDIVIELLDARIPYSSKNPDIDNIAKNKYRIIVLNKVDLADNNITQQWKKFFEEKGFVVVLANSALGNGLNDITVAAKELMKEKVERLKKKGRIFVPTRAMIVGIPNVGKSTLINNYVKKSIAKASDKPGVTRNKQWVKVKKDFELLDTPGILWPKFEDEQVGINLAITGAISDNIMDINSISLKLIEFLLDKNLESLEKRYKIKVDSNAQPLEILNNIGITRGFKLKGNKVDLERTAIILIDEFRAAKLGKITLESPIDYKA